MQVKRIQHYFEQYKRFLQSPESKDRLYIWESQRIFQENWNLEANDMQEMYDKSLENSKTRRLWSRESYAPKQMMMKFWDLQADYVRHMFTDLFNEDKEADGRVDRFLFYCDEMLKSYKEANPHTVENSHYHDDNYEMISLYLAFRFPERYTLYRHENFVALLHKLGAKNPPKANDIDRFFKVMRTLFTLIKKEATILELNEKRLNPERHYMEESLLLVFDFYQFCTTPSYKVKDYE